MGKEWVEGKRIESGKEKEQLSEEQEREDDKRWKGLSEMEVQ